MNKKYWNTILATIIVLRANTKARHWYMRGDAFFGAHSYFDEITSTIEDFEDYFAERKSSMGNSECSTLREILAASAITDATAGFSIEAACKAQNQDMGVLIGLVYDAISKGVFDPSDESGVTNWTDQLKNHAYWLAKFTNTTFSIPKVKLADG